MLMQIPSPETIRPKEVLARWLSILSARVAKGEISYEYFSNQLRAIRQDLTVVSSHAYKSGATHPRRIHRRSVRRALSCRAPSRISSKIILFRTI